MRKVHYTIVYTFFISISILAFACNKNDNDEIVSGQTIDEVLNSNSQYSLFAYAIGKVRLNVFSKGGGPYSFFVPTNDALAKVGIASNADVDNIYNRDSSFLAGILMYHIQSGLRTYDEIPRGPNTTLSSQNGVTQYASQYETGAFINGVKIADRGLRVSNGIVFTMDEVLPVLNSNSNVDFIGLMENTLMRQAIVKTNTTSSFTTNPSTIFAIPNAVMIANGYDSTTISGLSGTGLTNLANILRYHVISQRLFKCDFKTANYPTRFTGNNVAVGVNGNNITVKGKNNAEPYTASLGSINTSYYKYGTTTTSGIIYTINGMLKP